MIPQELSALMALRRGMQQGRVAATTPAGVPTVAAQDIGAAEQAAMPAIPQTVQQAGLGAQIQAMRMQEAQNALMNAAMQQQRQQQQQPVMAAEGGIMRLNPRMQDFAEGGIVGYAGAGIAREGMNPLVALLRKIGEVGLPTRGGVTGDLGVSEQSPEDRERALEVLAASTPMMDIPSVTIAEPERTPPSSAARPTGVATLPVRPSVQSLFEQGRSLIDEMKSGGASPEQIAAQEAKNRQAEEAFLTSRGLDPRYLEKRGAEDKALIDQQRALLRERMEREKGRDTTLGRVGEALRGFRQMKGQGIGTGILSAEDALSRRVAGTEARMDQMRDMELKINELEMVRRRALEDARHSVARGDWGKAQQELSTAQAAENEKNKMKASSFAQQATATVQERQVEEMSAARQADQRRVQELYQLRLNTLTGGKPPTDEQKMEAMEYALQTVKGAGSAARTAMAGGRLTLDQLRALQKTYAEQAADPMLPKAQREQAAQMLKQVNDELAGTAGIAAPTPKGGPAPGTVMEGYRFKGGNPADKANWEKV